MRATATALDARIAIIAGQQPLVEFLGRNTFFTELERKGRVDSRAGTRATTDSPLRPAAVFSRRAQTSKLDVRPGQATQSNVADRADVRSARDRLVCRRPSSPRRPGRRRDAAGVSRAIAAGGGARPAVRERPRLDRESRAAADGSPIGAACRSCRRWNCRRPGVTSMRGRCSRASHSRSTRAPRTIDQVLAEARRQGATVVQSNHPFIPYGYLASLARRCRARRIQPGASTCSRSTPTCQLRRARSLQALWAFWNAGPPLLPERRHRRARRLEPGVGPRAHVRAHRRCAHRAKLRRGRQGRARRTCPTGR